jgi:pyruvate formate lyase activating enzyme
MTYNDPVIFLEYATGRYELTDDGRCTRCGSAIPGRFDGAAGRGGRRR